MARTARTVADFDGQLTRRSCNNVPVITRRLACPGQALGGLKRLSKLRWPSALRAAQGTLGVASGCTADMSDGFQLSIALGTVVPLLGIHVAGVGAGRSRGL